MTLADRIDTAKVQKPQQKGNMQIIKQNQRRTLHPEPQTKVHEYDTDDAFISGAVAEIKGRYPAKGFVCNTRIKELAYIVRGTGFYLTQQDRTPLAAGDTLLIDHNEFYAWDGDMDIFLATAPAFDPQQYVHVGADDET